MYTVLYKYIRILQYIYGSGSSPTSEYGTESSIFILPCLKLKKIVFLKMLNCFEMVDWKNRTLHSLMPKGAIWTKYLQIYSCCLIFLLFLMFFLSTWIRISNKDPNPESHWKQIKYTDPDPKRWKLKKYYNHMLISLIL